MKNMAQMLKQAQQMQAKMAEMQARLDQVEMTGAAGGDLDLAVFEPDVFDSRQCGKLLEGRSVKRSDFRKRSALFQERVEFFLVGFFPFFGGEILRGKLGVRHQNLLEFHLSSGAYERKNLFPSQVAGGQNHVMVGDQFHAAARRVVDLPLLIHHRKRRR